MTETGNKDQVSKALKLSLDPDEYLCNWLFFDAEGDTARVPGAIMLGKADTQPHGTAFGTGVPLEANISLNGQAAYGFPQHSSFPVLRAELENNYSVTLLDVTVQAWFKDRAHIQAAAAMVGLYDATEEGLVARLRVQATGLDAASGQAPLQRQNVPFKHDANTEYVVKRNVAPQVWEDSDAKLSLSYVGNAHLGDPYEYGFTFSPVLTIQLTDPVPLLDAIREWVNPVLRILELASGKSELLTYVEAVGKNAARGDATWQIFGSGINQQPYDSNREQIHETKSALNLHADGDSLLTLIRAWNTHDGAGHPLIETFAKDLRWLKNQPPRAQVLTLCQAVEGAYDHTHHALVQDQQAEYDAKRARTLAAIKASEAIHGKDWKFVKNGIPKRVPSNLRVPLHWTAAAIPVELAVRASEIPIVIEKKPADNGSDWSDGIRAVRNDLAHGRSIPRDKLRPLATLLTHHLRAHTLSLLEASPATCERIYAD